MLGKNVKLFIDRMTEDYREQLEDIFNSEDIDFGEYGSFYEEGPICNIDEAEIAYQADLKDKEMEYLKRKNKQLAEQLSTYNEVNKKLQEVYEAYKKAEAENFFKEMGILDK